LRQLAGRAAYIVALAASSGCAYELETAPPSVDGVSPGLTCNAQLTTEITVSGKQLTPLPADVLTDKPQVLLPAIRIENISSLDGSDGSGDGFELSDARWLDNKTMAFDVTPELAITEGVYDLFADNPDEVGKEAKFEASIAVVPPPVLDTVTPNILCLDQADQEVVLEGQGFLVVGGELPMATVGGAELTPTSADTCFDLAGPVEAESCGSLAVTVPQGELSVGLHDVSVTNPETAACESLEPIQIEVVPPPRVDSIVEDLACNEQENTFVVTGDGFLVIDGVSPTVAIGSYSAEADAADGCTNLAGPGGGETCTELTLTVPADLLDEGALDVVVTNPPPADCVSTEPVQIDAVTAPVVTSLAPPDVCEDAGDTVVEVVGTGFVVLADGTVPTVDIDGVNVDVVGTNGCTVLPGPSGADTCTGLDVEVPTGTFVVVGQTHPVTVTNPVPADCSSNTDIELGVVGPPTIDSVVPTPVCDSATTFTVFGTGFSAGAVVEIDGVPVYLVTYIDDTELLIEVAPGTLTPGFHDIAVINGDGCDVIRASFLDVIAGPVLFFVDPPVIYSQMITEVSLFVGGLNNSPVAVWLEEDATGAIFNLYSYTFDGQNTVFVEVDAIGLGLAEGSYTFYIEDDQQCVPYLDSALYVEDDLMLQVTAIDPPFGWINADTPVDIRALDTGALALGEANFDDLPRVYLNPSTGGVATGLRSVSFTDETLLNGVVPDGLPADVYDVIVVNPPPGNEIGLLPLAFEVTTLPPPFVSSVAPNRMSKSAPTDLSIIGNDFRNATVDMTCQDGAGVVQPTDSCTVNIPGANAIDATCPSDNYGDGTVCVIRVTNDDATYYDYSAVSVGSPSGNLFQFFQGEAMFEGRRAPVVEAGRATDRARYLYAIGGDDGDPANASDTIEASPLDIFGNMRPWYPLPVGLPGPLTLGGSAVVGRFVFIAGGNGGLGPIDSVWRAQVLDPLAAPQLASLGLQLGGGPGLGLDGGRYIYRISAVFDPSNPVNPGGESLASDPIVLNVPALPDLAHIDITWTAVPGAIGYRVYRSPVADSGSGTEELLADEIVVLTEAYTDVGDATTPLTAPLPNGSLGSWRNVAQLPGLDAADAAREGACVGAGRDPVTDTSYLYVAGGRDGNGLIRDTISYLDIDTSVPDQVVGSFTTSANTLDEPKWMCTSYVVAEDFHTVVAVDETWMYFGMGDNGTGLSKVNEAGQISAGGELINYQDAGDINSNKSGLSGFAANNFLYTIGGATGSGPTERGHETSISGLVPILDNWSSLGGVVLSTERELAGSASESSIWYIVGGVDAGGTASDTVDYTNL